ncbi:uncharacterized protein LOC128390301 [Panonychus citri]|uniref:uncharacterized protein LOC128390301 n=1 Tax=Panonychus citri TaxID=50023 RepID=UPI002308215C|nr:uncharacterized protein LOC128390301 [Panonychus citri]
MGITKFAINDEAVNEVTKSINDLPWSVHQGNWIIIAKLFSSNGEVYDIREYIHSSDTVRGKISISSGDDQVAIYYSSEVEKDRLVVHNAQCSKFSFTNKWDNNLFNIDSKNPLLNHVLMTGPSILFRINGKRLTWTQGNDANIRGFPVHSAKTTFNENLEIIYYHKTHLISSVLLKANRLQLKGTDSSFDVTEKEDFYIDIYSITETKEDLDKSITVTPGIGCPFSLISSKSSDWFPAPEINRLSYHFTAKLTVDGPQKSITFSEMFVNSKARTAIQKTIEQGKTIESLYDYNLGTIHSSQRKGSCSVSGIGPNSPGMSAHNTFTAAALLNYEDYYIHYKYLGKVFIRSGYEAHVWERVDHDYEFQGEKHDKFVTNHYFVQSADAKLFKGFTLVRTTTNSYKKVNNETYHLIETRMKDYFGLEKTESNHDYETEASLRYSDCYPDSKDRKTFAIYFKCLYENEGHEGDCIEYGENHQIEFIELIKEYLLDRDISPSRVANIELVFNEKNMKALITFLKIPNIEDSLQRTRMLLPEKMISRSLRTTAKSTVDCLHQHTGLNGAQAVVFCNSQDVSSIICGWIEDDVTIKEDEDGLLCDIFYITSSFSQFRKEIHLDKMEERFHRNALQIYFTRDAYISYKSTKVVDVTAELLNGQNKDSFILVAARKRLINSKPDVILAQNVSNFGDCYHTCGHDDVSLCETFVFCQYTDKSSCFTSNIIYANLSSQSTEDEYCKIYSKNRLLDYIKISSREFKQSTSIAIDVPLDDCASMCSSSDECFSFQQCGGSCTLNGFYTDSISKESSDCNIYIPKVSQQFISTGRKIVSEVFHTEVNLNLDQCAALCHSWTNTNESCVSFNYCPKNGEISSCSLSKYSTNDKSATSIDSGVCKNYENKDSQLDKDKIHEDEITTKGTSGVAAFGIVILFITVGLLLGFIFPMLINEELKATVSRKMTFLSPSKRETNSFEWTKQIDQNDA